MRKKAQCLAGLALLLILPLQARAGSFSLYSGGDNVVVASGPPSDPNVLRVTSDTSAGQPGYGGMYYDATGDGLTLNTLTNLSALYEMTAGMIGGGAPRFTLFDSSGSSAYIYWGTPTGGGSFADPHPGTWDSTGNLASLTSPDVRVYVNGFGGQNTPNTGETYAQFVAALATTQIAYITLDLDGGFTGTQQMITDEFTVNGSVYEAGPDPPATPEPASLTLLGSAALSLAGYAWRRRRKVAIS